MSKTFLWIEDKKGKAGYIFWKAFMQQLCPNVIVESKKNNSELVKSVKYLNDTDNKYVIVFDNSFDNMQICQERRLLGEYVDVRENVMLMDIICFEYILLEFDKLISWIYAPNDEFLLKRAGAIKARESLIKAIHSDNMEYKALHEVMEYDNNLYEHNIEQLSAKLLFDLTRNTGFEVSKGNLGECWLNSCCDWKERQEDDICGLNDNRLSVTDKMKNIYTQTSLCKEFSNMGLEVL